MRGGNYPASAILALAVSWASNGCMPAPMFKVRFYTSNRIETNNGTNPFTEIYVSSRNEQGNERSGLPVSRQICSIHSGHLSTCFAKSAALLWSIAVTWFTGHDPAGHSNPGCRRVVAVWAIGARDHGVGHAFPLSCPDVERVVQWVMIRRAAELGQPAEGASLPAPQ
jgi:hypothetical protein